MAAGDNDGSSSGTGSRQLSADECVRAGMYWYGRADVAAAEAWWRRALYLDPGNTRAQECLRLIAREKSSPFTPPPAVPAKGGSLPTPTPAAFSPSFANPERGQSPNSARAALTSSAGILSFEDPQDLGLEHEELVTDSNPQIAGPRLVRSNAPTPVPILPRNPTPSYELVAPRPPSSPPSSSSSPSPPPPPPPKPRSTTGAGVGRRDVLPGPPPPPSINVDIDIDAAAWALEQATSESAEPRARPRPPPAPAPTPPLSPARTSKSNKGIVTPWDDGPSRTSAVTLDPDGPDALAESTPLPELEANRFFGRSLQHAYIAPPRPKNALSAPAIPILPVEESPAPSRSAPALAPDIMFTDPVELEKSAPAVEVPKTLAAILKDARDRLQLHDFGGAVDLLESIPESDPLSKEAKALAVDARSQLMRMLESKLGGLDKVPRVLISSEELIWLNLNHRAGFILSQIDGTVSYDDLIALSGMPRLDTLRILSELIEEKVIRAD